MFNDEILFMIYDLIFFLVLEALLLDPAPL